MHCRHFPVGILGMVVLVWAAGCTPEGPLALASLPGHKLDVSARPRWTAPGTKQLAGRKPKKVPGPRKPAMTAEEKRWFVPTARPWRYVVIHHSATPTGNAVTFDIAHRARGWDEMGYHFIVNNGHGGPDGQIEIGSRWQKQKWGAHCGGTPDNEYNNHGIGVCIVGDFGRRLPSQAQLSALERLVPFLMRTYEIPPDRVIGHCHCPNAATECPGQRLDEYLQSSLRPKLARKLAAR